MGESSLAGQCRLTVRGPGRVLDLAVPSDIPLADLLPVIVEHVGDDLPESGLEHGGWALQRIGGAPLDPEGTPDSLALRDGSVLLLRPLAEALPPVRFDNLVDGVTATVRGLPHSWTPEASRWSLRVALLSVMAAAFAVLATSGADRSSRAALAAGAALLALAGAGAGGRTLADRPGAVLLGLAASPFAALCAALVVGGGAGGEGPGARLLAASAAWGICAVLAMTVVATWAVAFVPSVVVALAGILAGVLMLTGGYTFSQAAGAAAVPAVVFGAFVPMLSFSLSGLRLPPLPTNADQLQEGIEPYPSTELTARTVVADHWMTGLYVAVGVICSMSLCGLARHPHLPETVTGGLLALVLVLHGRDLGNTWQRLALVLPGALGAALLTVCAARPHGQDGQLAAAAGLLAAAVAVAVMAWTVPGRRMLPYWGRAGDLLQSAAAIGLLPGMLWVLDVYADLRGVKG